MERVMAEARKLLALSDHLVAVIVLNRDRRHLLLRCLDSIHRLNWPHLTMLVVDNGSSDDSVAAVEERFPDVPLLALHRNLGVAGGRNAGLAWVMERHRPDYLLFVDDDTVLEQDSVNHLVAAAGDDERIGLVAPKAYRKPGELLLTSAGGMRFNPYLGAAWDVGAGEQDEGQYDRTHDVDACPGFAFFARSRLFERLGPFDENLNPYGWEDVEFSLRARAAGHRLVYAPGAVVWHLGGRIGRGPIMDYERHKVRNMLRLLQRHATVPQLLCFAGLLPARVAYKVGRELAGGNWAVVGAWLAAMVGSGRR
jgi:GT2 family glycosyltransferase